MTIEPDPGALFGSTPLAAMPLRMMQMFVGVPLVGTRNDLTAVVGRLSYETRQAEELQKRAGTQAEARIAELEKNMEETRKRIQSKPSARELRQAVQAANVRYAACEEQLRRLKIVRTAGDADASAAVTTAAGASSANSGSREMPGSSFGLRSRNAVRVATRRSRNSVGKAHLFRDPTLKSE
jgi:hypothetical protein